MTIALDGWILLYKKRLTTVILFLLLLLRFSDFYLSKIWGEYYFFYETLISFPLLVFVIWLNKDNLQSVHVDKPFIFFFLLSGTLISFYFWPSILGVTSIAGTVYIFILLNTKGFVFENPQSPHWIAITVLGLIPILVLFILYYPNLFTLIPSIVIDTPDAGWLLTSRLYRGLFEEIVFRGMLWLMLSELKIKDGMILLIQAILFWFAHTGYLPRLSFWTTIPFLSLWLGYLTLRSKSLTPSTISHVLYNFVLALFN